MKPFQQKTAIVITLTATAVLISSCASNINSRKPPNYAIAKGDGWEVRCDFNRVYLNDRSVDPFYNKDGSVKELREFCQDNLSTSRPGNR